jgi:single-strand DNA-binding protein
VGRIIKIKSGENLMEYINRIELQGRVGTVRTNTVNGSMVVNFSLATELLYKNREGGGVSETTWHNVVAWSGKEMPDLSGITVGTSLNVVGRMRSTKYTAADGTDKHFYEVMASRIRIVTETDSGR